MRQLIATLKREIGLFVSYRTFSVLTIALPIVAIAYFLVLLNSGSVHDLPIAVIDGDKTSLSRKLERMIDATPTARKAYDINSMAEGEQLMREGKIDAIVIIPKGMERKVYKGEQANVVAYVSGTNVTKNGLLDRDIRTTLYTFSSGIQIQTMMKKGVSEKEAYDMMMPIYFEKHTLFNPWTNYGYYLLPVFLPMMILIFTLLSTIFTIGSELKNGTAGEWLSSGGGRIVPAYFGKILPYTLIFTALIMVSNVIMYKLVGVPLRGNRELLIFSSVLFVLAYQSVGVVIVTLAANLRLALSLGGGYSVLAFTFSGLTFPLMAMSWVAVVFSKLFPLTFYMNIFVDQAMRGAPAQAAVIDMLWLLIFIVLPLPLLPRLKRLCSDSKYWGKL